MLKSKQLTIVKKLIEAIRQKKIGNFKKLLVSDFYRRKDHALHRGFARECRTGLYFKYVQRCLLYVLFLFPVTCTKYVTDCPKWIVHVITVITVNLYSAFL